MSEAQFVRKKYKWSIPWAILTNILILELL